MSLPAELQNVLAETQAAFDQADFMDDWSPDDGDCNALLAQFVPKVYTDKDTGSKSINFNLKFQVIDGEFKGRNFWVRFRTTNPSQCGPVFDLAARLADNPAIYSKKDVKACAQALEANQGKAIIVVNKSSRYSDKYQRFFPNWKFSNVSLAAN